MQNVTEGEKSPPPASSEEGPDRARGEQEECQRWEEALLGRQPDGTSRHLREPRRPQALQTGFGGACRHTGGTHAHLPSNQGGKTTPRASSAGPPLGQELQPQSSRAPRYSSPWGFQTRMKPANSSECDCWVQEWLQCVWTVALDQRESPLRAHLGLCLNLGCIWWKSHLLSQTECPFCSAPGKL